MSKHTHLNSVLSSVRRQFWPLLGLSLLANLLLLTSSIYMLQIFDRVLSSGSLGTLTWLSVIAVSALVVFGLLELSRRKILSAIGSWVESELSGKVMKRSIEARLKSGNTDADVSDVADIRGFLSGDAILAFLDAPWTPAFLFLIWLMHPVLGFIGIIAAILLFLIAVANDVLTREKQAQTANHLRKVRSDASVFVEHAETLAALGMIQQSTERWKARRDAVDVESDWAKSLALLFLSASRTIRMIVQVSILGAGAYLVLVAELTPGGMIAASIILSRALSPVERAISAWRGYGSYKEAKSNLRKLFEQTGETTERIELERPAGALNVNGLRYHAPQTGEAILKNISLSLEPGTTLAIIGASGSGKSSLCKCLVGAWPPTFGTVRIDGADISDWNSNSLGQYIGYLPQTVRLFSGTISENIARLKEPDNQSILSATKMVGAHEMILGLPEGYETETGPFSDLLSGGQKQRIAMARALYGDPSIVVFDEPDTSLDGNGDLALAGMIKNLKESGKTVIFISHTPTLLRFADKVAVLKNGEIDRFGPTDQVLSSLMKGAVVALDGKKAQVSS